MTARCGKGYVLASSALIVLGAYFANKFGDVWQGPLAVALLVAMANLLGLMEGEERR